MKKIRGIIGFYLIMILSLFLVLGSCGKATIDPPKTDEEPTVSSVSKVESLQVRGGKGRAELSWRLSDPDLTKVRISWNDGRNYIETRARIGNEPDKLIIDNLAEGEYIFEVYTYDRKGKKSEKVEVSGRSYGPLYEQSLSAANFSRSYKEGNNLKIDWEGAENQLDGLVRVELSYENSERKFVDQKITDVVGKTTTLTDFWDIGGFRYRSAYIPEPLAIDTFYTVFRPYYPFEVDPSKFVTQIQQHTNLVNSIVKNTTVELEPGLLYTEIDYLNAANKAMALYVLTADMTKGVTLKASAASNGRDLNAKETVMKQIEHVQGRGYDVLAAVNADFWRTNVNEVDNTPLGQPYGLLYMDGTRYKPFTSNFEYYFTAVLDDGTITMGNKQDYAKVSRRVKEAVGGRYLLVRDGKDVAGGISNTDINPRTSIGKFSPDKFVFIVIDGRRTGHSEGLTMQEMGKMYEAIGVRTAINLDGGGSTTLVLAEGAGFAVKNKPTDPGGEREVTNSWTIVKESYE